MLKLTKKVEYGLRGLYYLAFVNPHGYVHVRMIAQEIDVPKRFLEQIFLELREYGILKSRRGSRGGYHLAANSKDISVGLLYQILEAQVPPEKPPFQGSGSKRYQWNAQKMQWDFLQTLTLDHLLSDDIRDYLRSGNRQSMLYYI